MVKYKVIITKNRKKIQTLHRGRTLEYADKKFNKFYQRSRNVLFPKKYNNNNVLTISKFEILLIERRDKEQKIKNRIVRDDLGRLVEEKILNNNWVIRKKRKYDFEETFMVIGYDNRLSAKEIIKNLLMVGVKDKGDYIKQIVTLFNKVLFYNKDGIKMVVCKCVDDANKLYNLLEDFTEANNLTHKFLFFGEVHDQNRSKVYDELVKITGWKRHKLYRKSTRPNKPKF